MSNLREEIEEIYRKAKAYHNAGDFTGLGSLFAEDFKLLAPGRPMVIGREAAVKTAQSLGVKSLQTTTEEVGTAGGDVIYSRGVYKLSLTDGKEDVGKFVTLWKRVDGQLYFYTDVFNSDKS